jgi:hypothetical protein
MARGVGWSFARKRSEVLESSKLACTKTDLIKTARHNQAPIEVMDTFEGCRKRTSTDHRTLRRLTPKKSGERTISAGLKRPAPKLNPVEDMCSENEPAVVRWIERAASLSPGC